jgi:hypothetical protein
MLLYPEIRKKKGKEEEDEQQEEGKYTAGSLNEAPTGRGHRFNLIQCCCCCSSKREKEK